MTDTSTLGRMLPAEGLTVRDPVTLDPLPLAGRDLPDTSYWRRRWRDGDIEPAPAAEADAPKKQAKSKEA